MLILLREICHRELACLVGRYGACPLDQDNLDVLISSSVEPDQDKISLKKLYDHTINARRLTLRNIKIAIVNRRECGPLWIKYLGWAFHFITDWGTPYHSPISISNPVIWKTLLNTTIGIVSEYINTMENDRKKRILGIAKKALEIGLPTLGTELKNLIINHGEFEDFCDNQWIEYKSLIHNKFMLRKVRYRPSMQLGQTFEELNSLMNNLRQYSNNMPSDWTKNCDGSKFADYMVKIANVLDFACQIVMM